MSSTASSQPESFAYKLGIIDQFARIFGVILILLFLLALWGWSTDRFHPFIVAIILLFVTGFGCILLVEMWRARKKFVFSAQGIEVFQGNERNHFVPWSELVEVRAYAKASFEFRTSDSVLKMPLRRPDHFAVLAEDFDKYFPTTHYPEKDIAESFVKNQYYWFAATGAIAGLSFIFPIGHTPWIMIIAGTLCGCVLTWWLYRQSKREPDKPSAFFPIWHAIGWVFFMCAMGIQDYSVTEHRSVLGHMVSLTWFYVTIFSQFIAGLLLPCLMFYREKSVKTAIS